MIATDAKNMTKVLSAEPVVDSLEVLGVRVKAVAKVSAMDENVTRKVAQLVMFPMSVAGDDNPH